MHLYNVNDLKVGDVFSVIRKSNKDTQDTGMLIHVMRGGIVIKQYMDFLENGYIVIKNEDILDVMHGKRENNFQSIVEAENRNIVSVEYKFLTELLDWKSAFFSIYERGIICGYEAGNELYLGRLVSLGEKRIELICFRQDFFCEKKPYGLNKSDISAIHLDSDYINIYTKYSGKIGL